MGTSPIRGTLVLICLLVGGGCARGTAQPDAGPQQDAAPPGDAGPQVDAATDAAAQRDGAADAPLLQDGAPDAPQQDAQRDVLPQQDVIHDTSPPPECTTDQDCQPDAAIVDGGRYCYTQKGRCYEPGICTNDTECPTGSVCKPLYGSCSCSYSPLLLCRDHETCIPAFQICGAN